MPSILISNQFLAARTGSELHVLTLARLFSRAGWDVTCFTLLYGHPLQADFERDGIHVVTLGSESLLSDHYDVLFAQHRIVAEHLWNIDRISFGKVIVSALGFITSAEEPPAFYPKADGFVFVSEETRDHVRSNVALGDMPVMVFPNYAPSEYFEVSRRLPERPRRVCVLSNHPPRELHELAVLGPTRDIEIDLFGYETTSVEVTPELVSQYDVVVSIGRTAQPCLAAGIPFYCYDQFGGPGYITPENVARHAYNNFSGRSEQTKRSSEELLDDLMAGYAGATGGTEELRALAREEYDLNALFARLSSFIEGIPASPDNRHRPPASYETISADYVTRYEFLKVMDRFFGTARSTTATRRTTSRRSARRSSGTDTTASSPLTFVPAWARAIGQCALTPILHRAFAGCSPAPACHRTVLPTSMMGTSFSPTTPSTSLPRRSRSPLWQSSLTKRPCRRVRNRTTTHHETSPSTRIAS